MPFLPGSTSKIAPMIAALKILGPQYRFKTTVSFDGTNLYLKGSGDPSLMISDLMDLTQSLVKRGIHKIKGQFYYDENELLPSESIELERETWAPFNSGLSALSVSYNQMNVFWSPLPTDPKQRDTYFVPNVPLAKVSLNKEPIPEETKFIYKSEGNQDVWYLSANASNTGKERLPVKRAGLWTAMVFAEFCKMKGIEIPAPRSGKAKVSARILATHESASLIEIEKVVLEYSNNMMAELIQMAAARKLVHRPIGMKEAAHLIGSWLRKRIPSIDWKGFEYQSGSGLSSQNRMTPHQMAAILRFADQQSFHGKNFESLLPVMGWSPGVENRLTSPTTALRIWAKPGGINYGKSLVGFLHSSSHKRYIFAIMVSDMTARAEIDKIATLLSGSRHRLSTI